MVKDDRESKMAHALDQISAEETRALSRRRSRANWIVFGLLAAFVVAVFVISFTHIRNETNRPEATVRAK